MIWCNNGDSPLGEKDVTNEEGIISTDEGF